MSLRSAARSLLWPLGQVWGAWASARNTAYDEGRRRCHRLPVPVVSVGNLAVGGTGKTPVVAWLATHARARGRTPGVLARGYGRAAGAALNDEGAMLARELPWLLQEQDPDRVAAGARLCGRGADYVILDDGMQHRRLRRDRELVCLDARAPFGNGRCLPAGPLREWPRGLRRATTVLLTRADGVEPAALAATVARVREAAGDDALPVHACAHAPVHVRVEPDGDLLPLDALRGQRVVLLSAIARPEAFAATVRSLGAEVCAERRHRDHHRYTGADAVAAAAAAAAHGALLLTTAKDAVKLEGFGIRCHVLAIALQFLAGEPSLAEVAL